MSNPPQERLFVGTVHGESAVLFTFPGKMAREVLKEGIHDGMLDRNLDAIAPKDYYRSVFQTKAYTLHEYSRYFDILEYVERGGTASRIWS